MPDKSKAQRNLMEGIAHGTIPAGGKRPTKKVAEDFLAHDKALGVKPSDLPAKVGKGKPMKATKKTTKPPVPPKKSPKK